MFNLYCGFVLFFRITQVFYTINIAACYNLSFSTTVYDIVELNIDKLEKETMQTSKII